MIANFTEFSRVWSALHGNVAIRGLIAGWLRISYQIARLCMALRIGPSVITLMGAIAAAATALFAPHWWIAPILAFSLICDGVDGSVAIIQNRVSKMGAVLDAIADRVAEIFWAVAFYRLGAPLTWVLALWLVASLQEYARARLASTGSDEVGIVTPAERPVRASFLFIAILAWQFRLTHEWVSALAISLTLLQFLSFILVFGLARKRLA